jgi:ABC-type multidrug transport system fused ATPase/permease subunit
LKDIAKASVAASRIIDMRSKDHLDGKLISLDVGNIGDGDMGVKINFQNVWFKYPTRDVPILNGLSLTVSTKSRPWSSDEQLINFPIM